MDSPRPTCWKSCAEDKISASAFAALDNPMPPAGAFIAHDLLRRPRQHEKPRLASGPEMFARDRSIRTSHQSMAPPVSTGLLFCCVSVSGLETGDTTMSAEFTPPGGVWLPLITPFRDESDRRGLAAPPDRALCGQTRRRPDCRCDHRRGADARRRRDRTAGDAHGHCAARFWPARAAAISVCPAATRAS